MSVKTKKKAELNEEKVIKAIEILKLIQTDVATPKSVRKLIKEAQDYLLKKDLSPGVRAASAIQLLEEANQDPNLPMLSRTRIWNALSMLETVKD
ncbi:MAG: UPF0147 family protein [Thermoproteota archaeon]|nr:UPF0147 family protein [Candidatus Brockarchaeota archaeon]MBO3768000.1 UPF0147 family protein [Candidatus Brockarchaeota archaeon]MBO3801692.1 UPF0147 family protein [Candidatus Brockarchaeota archaeon]